MKIQKIPLAQRLQRMEAGYPAHPEYNASAILSMAHTPISVYLHDHELERAQLGDLLEPWGANGQMTYQEIAAYIRDLRRLPEQRIVAEEAASLLAAPLLRCYRERRGDYGAFAENPAG